LEAQHHLEDFRCAAERRDVNGHLQLRVRRRVLQDLGRARAFEGQVLDVLAKHVELSTRWLRRTLWHRRRWAFAGAFRLAVAVALVRGIRAFRLLGHGRRIWLKGGACWLA